MRKQTIYEINIKTTDMAYTLIQLCFSLFSIKADVVKLYCDLILGGKQVDIGSLLLQLTLRPAFC